MMTSAATRSPLALLSGTGIAAASATQATAPRDPGAAGAVFGSMLGDLMPAGPEAAEALPTPTTAPDAGMPARPADADVILTARLPLAEAVPGATRGAAPQPDAVAAADETEPTDDDDDVGAAEAIALALPLPLPSQVPAAGARIAGNDAVASALSGLSLLARSAVAGRMADPAVAQDAVMTAPDASGQDRTPVAFLNDAAGSGNARGDAQASSAWLAARPAQMPAAGAATEADAAMADLPDGLLPVTGSGQAGTLATAARGAAVITVPQHAFTSPDWGDAFSSHLVTLAQQGSQTATLQLNPQELGPIQVRITVSDQAASVEFATRHADTGDLIESAMPRLASALEAHGMRLEDARVSQMARHESLGLPGSQQGHADTRGGQGGAGQSGLSQGGQGGGAATTQGRASDALAGDAAEPATGARRGDGQVDYYA